jgi:hypothetical protein
MGDIIICGGWVDFLDVGVGMDMMMDDDDDDSDSLSIENFCRGNTPLQGRGRGCTRCCWLWFG